MSHSWPRIIAHVDLDAFFAQVEQRDFPELRRRPVCITNGEKGSCIITRSYEARAYGITTGMRLYEARRLCPHLLQQPSRPQVYAAISATIMQVLATITPDIEIFSVDEAFLDLSRCRGLYQGAKQVAHLIRQRIFMATQLTCSVGVGGDKTSAKIATKRAKPDGFFVIVPWQAKLMLSSLPVTDICGINRGIAQFLAQYGVYYCGQMESLPISVLARRYGNVGRRLWHMCLGQDPDPVRVTVAPPKSMGHGKVMPPNTRDRSVILSYLSHMAEKVAYRLRQHHMVAQQFYIGIKLEQGWVDQKYKTIQPLADGYQLYLLAKQLILQHWQGEGVFQCQVTALDPRLGCSQGDLFLAPDHRREQLNTVMDSINHKFGQRSLTQARQLQPLQMPDVIAPAWRPEGHRASIVIEKAAPVQKKIKKP